MIYGISGRHSSRIVLIALILLYIGMLRPPPANMAPGIDPSIRFGINVYAEYGLHFGTDIVHVYGPLGRLIYPVAGDTRLIQATYLSLILNAVFIFLIIMTAFQSRKYGRAIFILAVFAFYASFLTFKIREAHLVGIPLLCYIMSVAERWTWPSILGAVLSGFFAFLKFNVAVSLLILLFAYLTGIYLLSIRPLKTCLFVFGVYAVTIAGTAALVFSSLNQFLVWIIRSWHIAAGNSEIMSRDSNQVELILSFVVIGLIIGMAFINRKRQGSPVTLFWLVLVGVPVFFEFKHGFVRAGDHVIFFFGFVPIAVSYSVLLFNGWKTWSSILAISILCTVGAAMERIPMVPWKWRHPPDFRIMKLVTDMDTIENTKEKVYIRNICSHSPYQEEVALIDTASVDLLPFDISPLLCGPMVWKPSPFYQHLLIRDAYSDSINAAHYETNRAAEYVFFSWSILDTVHPFYWCPETYRALIRHYIPVSCAPNRFLLMRAMPRDIISIPLDTVSVRFDEQVEIPESSYPVFARIHLCYSIPGKLIKALYRAPPVFIQYDDAYTSRIVPGTAPNGLLCNYIPRIPDHLMDFFAGRSPRPLCPRTRRFKIYTDESLPVYKNEIRIVFEEMRVLPDYLNIGEGVS